MVVILPNKRTGLAALEKKLATRKLSELLQQTVFTEVKVYLPKFKIETTLDLKHCLSSKVKINKITFSFFYYFTFKHFFMFFP